MAQYVCNHRFGPTEVGGLLGQEENLKGAFRYQMEVKPGSTCGVCDVACTLKIPFHIK